MSSGGEGAWESFGFVCLKGKVPIRSGLDLLLILRCVFLFLLFILCVLSEEMFS